MTTAVQEKDANLNKLTWILLVASEGEVRLTKLHRCCCRALHTLQGNEALQPTQLNTDWRNFGVVEAQHWCPGSGTQMCMTGTLKACTHGPCESPNKSDYYVAFCQQSRRTIL